MFHKHIIGQILYFWSTVNFLSTGDGLLLDVFVTVEPERVPWRSNRSKHLKDLKHSQILFRNAQYHNKIKQTQSLCPENIFSFCFIFNHMNHMKIQKLFLYVIYLLILDYNKCDFKDMLLYKMKNKFIH